MRLGVSLPCVDIALHMDPITEVDTIYQSMFRVLTERNGKKKAYFIDLLKSRFINFFYNLEDNVNNKKKPLTPKERLEKARDLLYSTNLNGISMQDSTKDYMNVYKKLVEEIGLNDEATFLQKTNEFVSNTNMTNNIVNLIDDATINKLYEIIKAQKSSVSVNPMRIRASLLNRTGPIAPTKEVEEGEEGEADEASEEGEAEEAVIIVKFKMQSAKCKTTNKASNILVVVLWY